jgi:autotransporter-associated beta strand protein
MNKKLQRRRVGRGLQRAKVCIAILLAITIAGGWAAVTTAEPTGYTWTGAESSQWNVSSLNWLDGGSEPAAWVNSSTAIFNGSGTGSITVDYSIVVGGITVSSSGYSFTSGSITLGNYGGTPFQIDNDVTVDSDLSGGPLLKNGNGALTVSSVFNTFSGATVSAGTLVGTTASLPGDITNNAVVTFDQGFDGTYSGSMSGSGSLTKLGVGQVTLSGNNSYYGGTTVTAGSLIGTTDSLQGAIANDGVVTFDQSSDGTYSGAISGSGNLNKSGSGAVTLSGNSNYTGTTTVENGSLFVTGNVSGSAFSVESGGLLGGDGTIGGSVMVLAGGGLAPGNSPGLLTVGSLQLDASSTTFFEITGTTPAVDYDQISVTNSLNYGGTLSLTLSGIYADYTSFALFTDFTSTDGSLAAVTLSAAGTPYDGLSFSETTPGFWETGWVDPSLPNYSQKLVFSQSTGVLAVVPEPSTYAMALVGIVCGGYLLRRRRSDSETCQAVIAA